MQKLFIIALALVCVFGFFIGRSYSQQTTYTGRVQFASTTGAIKFFDSQTGKVYKYSDTDGVLMQVWTLEALGENLKIESQAASTFEY
ncbi:MAG: hypothetical protein V1727_00040 [Candidatus Omnitrophota bacterium]